MVKRIFKFIGSFLIGVILGLAGVMLIVVLFTDITLDKFIHILLNINLSKGLVSVLVGIVASLIVFPLQIVLHEGGHLVCGLLSGYRFVSFRVFNWTFIREDGKLRIKNFAIAGTGGQCLLAPPEKALDEIPMVGYNLGGVLANVLCVLAVLPLLWIVDNPYLHEFFFLFCLIGVFLIILNGIPMKVGGISNDAYNVFFLRRDRRSREALMMQLRVNALVQQGVRPKDMPAEWFSIDGSLDYKNPFQLYLYIANASRLLDFEKWEEAHRMFEETYRHRADIIGLYVKEIACELLFTSLVTERTELAAELYTEDLKKYIQQFRGVMSSKERVLCAIAKFMEHDEAKAHSICESVRDRRHKFLMQGEIESDLALMDAIL